MLLFLVIIIQSTSDGIGAEQSDKSEISVYIFGHAIRSTRFQKEVLQEAHLGTKSSCDAMKVTI